MTVCSFTRKRLGDVAALFCALGFLAFTNSVAQELEPRTYNNTPTGVNIVALAYAYSSGNVLLDPTLPVEDLDGKLNIGAVGYTRTFGLLGRNAKFKTYVPYAFGDWQGTWEGEPATRDARGFGDIRLKLEWNFYGAPALKGKEFAAWQQKTIVGTSLLVVTPTSDYNSDKVLNLGSNRWSLRPEIGVSRSFGKFALEAMANVWLFGDNDNFVGGNTIEQDPLYVLKGHLVYTVRPGFWFGAGLGIGRGGQTKINGEARATEQENFRYGLQVGYPFNKQHGISASYVSAKNNGAGSEYDAFALAYKYAWGAY